MSNNIPLDVKLVSPSTPSNKGVARDVKLVNDDGSAVQVIWSNLEAITSPSVNDDIDDGYLVGSIWVNTASDQAYICSDNTASAAVWTSITAGASGGEANTASNVGSGTGLVFYQKSGVDLQFKTLVAGSNISIVNGVDTITIDASAAGEANTASNVGSAGTGIFKQKSTADLQFYKLNSTSNLLTIALDGTDKIDFTINNGNISHSALSGGHNLTTDIDHDSLTNFSTDEHFTQASITTLGTVTVGNVDAIVNASSVGLGNVTNTAQVPLSGGTMTGQLNFSGTDHAGIKVLSLTTAQRDALAPSAGMIIYNTTTATYEGYILNWVNLAAQGNVTSVFSRTGAVTAQSNDYTWGQINKATSDIADITTRSHTSLSDIGTNTHSNIDSHIGSTSNPHSVTASQTNAVALSGGTMTGQLNFSGTDHAGIKLISLNSTQRNALTPAAGMIIFNTTTANLEGYDGSNWVDLTQQDTDTTDHTALSNIGTNSHSTIDTHLGSTSNPHSVTASQAGAVALAGGTMTGQLNFSGTDHAGIKLLNISTTNRDNLTPAEGMLIANSTTHNIEYYDGTGWVDLTTTGTLSNIVEDTTPQLGGDLDMNSHNIGGISPTIFGYLSNISGDVQSQIGGKANVAGDTFSGLISFTGTNHYGLKLINLNTTQRDALTPASGHIIFNTTTSNLEGYDGSSWVDLTGAGGSGISNVVEDTTPQLGGDLDMNSNAITSAGTIDLEPASTVKIGTGAAGVDYTLQFNGEDADGTITFDEDAAKFLFDQDLDVDGNITATNLSGTNTGDQSRDSLGIDTDDTVTFAGVLATTFDTNVASAGVTLTGTTLVADGTDENISINITPKGTGDVLIGAFDLAITGSIGATGSRVTKGWFVDLEVTNAIAGSVTGNAGTVTNGVYTTSQVTVMAATDTGDKDKFLHSNASTGALEWTTVSGGTDEKVKYDAGDSTAGYVADKIIAGTGISVAEGTGADENKLVVTCTITQYTNSDAISAIQGDASWNASDWDTAFGWGDHSAEGYVTGTPWTSEGYLTSVTAHDLLSATHGDTTAGAVARGDIITGQGATPKWAKLALGTSGKVLISDGTDIGWSTSALGSAAYAATGDFAAALGADDNYVTDAEKIVIGNTSGTNTGDQDLSGLVTKSTFDAHTILYATTDNTPAALTVGEQTLVGRLSGGNISAITIGITDNNIVQIDQADVADNDFAKFTANGLEGRSYSEVLSDIGAAAASHASQHAVGGSDTVFPADPGADKFLMWDDDPGALVWADVPAAGANTALSNLSSVAINTTLVSDTDNTDALGTTAIAWSDLFLGNGAVITFNSAPSTADVTITHSANTLTIAGGDLALGANNLTMTGSLAATASRVTKGWFTDIESTNMPSVGGAALNTVLGMAGASSLFPADPGADRYLMWDDDPGQLVWATVSAGTPTAITVANEASDTTCFPLFVTAATGDLGPKTNAGLSFNSSTAVLTATGFAGPLTGNVTGNCSGTAATVTGATQASITTCANLTTVGTIGTGVWQGTTIKANYLQQAAADLGAANVTVNLSNSNGSYVTNLTIDGTLTATDYSTGGLLTKKSSESVVDDGTITLATGVSGVCEVWTEAEHMKVYIAADGTVTSLFGTANTAVTDSDTDLCVYDGGSGGVIKNRLGGTKTVRYIFNYS